MPNPPLRVRELSADPDLLAAFPLLKQLRPHLAESTFLDALTSQRGEGYRLFGGFAGEAGDQLVVAAGIRETCTLARGPHLFVDDLVTDAAHRNQGFGQAMLHWLNGYAAERGLPRIYLDSRDTAMGFYRQLGFTFLTSVPCWIEVREA